MIERDDGYIWISCDECGDSTMQFRDDEFSEMLAEAKGSGWRIKRVAGDWVHTCLTCQPEQSED